MTDHSIASSGIDVEFLQRARIVDANGNPAQLLAVEPGAGGPQARMQLHNGMQLRVPVALFAADGEASCRLPFAADDTGAAVMPVREETLSVDTRAVEIPRGIRVHRHVDEHVERIVQPLSEDVLEVERVAVGAIVDAAQPPQVREEGDMLVVPVLEEVLVVQKQLRLREELRIRRGSRQREHRQAVQLRRERVDVERFDENGSNDGAADGKTGSPQEPGDRQA